MNRYILHRYFYNPSSTYYLFSINIRCKVNKIQLSPILSISCHENTILTIYGMQLTFASQNNHNIVLTTKSLVSTQQSSNGSWINVQLRACALAHLLAMVKKCRCIYLYQHSIFLHQALCKSWVKISRRLEYSQVGFKIAEDFKKSSNGKNLAKNEHVYFKF